MGDQLVNGDFMYITNECVCAKKSVKTQRKYVLPQAAQPLAQSGAAGVCVLPLDSLPRYVYQPA